MAPFPQNAPGNHPDVREGRLKCVFETYGLLGAHRLARKNMSLALVPVLRPQSATVLLGAAGVSALNCRATFARAPAELRLFRAFGPFFCSAGSLARSGGSRLIFTPLVQATL